MPVVHLDNPSSGAVAEAPLRANGAECSRRTQTERRGGYLNCEDTNGADHNGLLKGLKNLKNGQ